MTPKRSHKHSHGSRKSAENEARPGKRDEAADHAAGDFDLEAVMSAAGAATPDATVDDAAATTAEDQTSPADAAEAAGAGPEPAESGAVAELQAQRERYLRLAAEYDNYRKRTDRERSESSARAQGQIVERLLDVIDDLERVAHVDPQKVSVTSVIEGVQLVERKLVRMLESTGLEVVDAEGQPFDPEVHEAIATAPAEGPEADDTVSDVFQKGYLFKGNLLRPARVRVYKHDD
jgi:molecular chaperone GrpE